VWLWSSIGWCQGDGPPLLHYRDLRVFSDFECPTLLDGTENIMSAFYKRGDRVKHKTKTDWGLGEVLADQEGDKIQIVFEDAGLKMFRVDVAPLLKVEGEESQSPHLGILVKQERKRMGRPKNAAASPHELVLKFSEAVVHFLKHFPGGFQDLAYQNSERAYKTAARDLMADLLGRDAIRDLNSAGEYAKVCQHASRVMSKTSLISPYEKLWLRNGTDSPGRQQIFATSLENVLYGEGPASERFEAFFRTLYELGAAKWPIATHFQFLAFPETHIFLKPQVTKHVAKVVGMDIRYTTEVIWATYACVLNLAAKIRAELVKDGREILVPKDMIDVQSFIWVVGAYEA